MQVILPNSNSIELKKEIKIYELKNLISDLEQKIGSTDFFELVKNTVQQDGKLSNYKKRDTVGQIINWDDFRVVVNSPDFDEESAHKYIQKLEIRGSRNDERLKGFITHLSCSFTPDGASFKEHYYTSFIIAQTFGVHFSADLFAEYVFDSMTSTDSNPITFEKLILDCQWANQLFKGNVKDIILNKIKKYLIASVANKLTPAGGGDNDFFETINYWNKVGLEKQLNNDESGFIDRNIKKRINYQCVLNLLINYDRFRFCERTVDRYKNLEDIFSRFAIDKAEQHNTVMEYTISEIFRITENKTSLNKKGNHFNSDVGKEIIQQFLKTATEEDIKLITNKLKSFKVKESILVEFEADESKKNELKEFISQLNLDTTIVNFDDDLLEEAATTGPGLVSLFKKFKITDMAGLEGAKKILGIDIFRFAISQPDYTINFELADLLKYKKYGLVGWQINNICPRLQGKKFESESDEVKAILDLLTGGEDGNWEAFNKENIVTSLELGGIEGVVTVDQEYLDELRNDISNLKHDIDNDIPTNLYRNNEAESKSEYLQHEDEYWHNSGEERKHNAEIPLRNKNYDLDEYDRLCDLYDQQNKEDPGFRNMFEVFGYKEMMAYSTNKDITPHDALFCFNEILHLYGQSGLSSQEFYNNILSEIKADTASYDSGSAHHMLNSISQGLKSEYAYEMEQTLAGYRDIFPESTLVTMQDVYASWSNLKKFYNLFQSQSELRVLGEIKEKGSDKQLKYAQELLFHKGSKVNANEVIRFITNPDSFFHSGDNHSNSELHNNKKPSNYYDIPHLPLTAEDLRDAIIEGSLDQIQAFRPLEIEYAIPKTDIRPPTFEEDLARALGSRQKGLQPEAKNIKDLNRNLRSVLEKNNYTFEKFTDFMETLVRVISGKEEITAELQEQLEKALYSKQNGITRFEPEKTTFVAKVNLKSDPNGVLAGDDTACCMPFGSGKNNIYTANPNCGMFTIQAKQADGTLRTIAQSVLTKDYETQETIPQLMSIISSGDLDKVSDMTEKSNLVLSCDNIELNPNWKNYDSQEKIRTIYQDFFKEYLDRFSELDNLDPNKIIIGKGYTDLTMNVPEIANKFLPLAPVAYSDKTHDKVLSLAVDSSSVPKNQKKSQINKYEKKIDLDIITPGVSYATFEDTLAISYIETTKAYADNQDSITGLHNMENGLIAKDIYNAHHERPNMSIKYADRDGKIRGYLLAYEGAGDKEFPEFEEFLYISDLATDKTSRVPGGRLLQGFTELYEKNYLSKNNLMPIRSQSRESSSYMIIQKQLSQLGEKLGVEFDLIERGFVERNGEKFFQTMIAPKKIEP
jgi:hypothetical protein